MTDALWRKLKAEYTGHWTKQKKYRDAIKEEEKKDKEKQNAKTLKNLKAKEEEYTHKVHISELYVDAREVELPPKINRGEAQRLRTLAKEEEQEWAKSHPASEQRVNAAGPEPRHQPGHSRLKSSGPQSLED